VNVKETLTVARPRPAEGVVPISAFNPNLISPDDCSQKTAPTVSAVELAAIPGVAPDRLNKVEFDILIEPVRPVKINVGRHAAKMGVFVVNSTKMVLLSHGYGDDCVRLSALILGCNR
jgi:hypothetical protein